MYFRDLPPPTVIPSDCRSVQQSKSYPTRGRSVSEACLFTTKFRGDDGGGMLTRSEEANAKQYLLCFILCIYVYSVLPGVSGKMC